jgi:hypothetical protein
MRPFEVFGHLSGGHEHRGLRFLEIDARLLQSLRRFS